MDGFEATTAVRELVFEPTEWVDLDFLDGSHLWPTLTAMIRETE